MKQKHQSVWDAIESSPAEAENMKLRSSLMINITEAIKSSGLTQAQAAAQLGITQPRVSDLTRGKIELFGLDTLVKFAAALGLHVEMSVTKAA